MIVVPPVGGDRFRADRAPRTVRGSTVRPPRRMTGVGDGVHLDRFGRFEEARRPIDIERIAARCPRCRFGHGAKHRARFGLMRGHRREPENPRCAKPGDEGVDEFTRRTLIRPSGTRVIIAPLFVLPVRKPADARGAEIKMFHPVTEMHRAEFRLEQRPEMARVARRRTDVEPEDRGRQAETPELELQSPHAGLTLMKYREKLIEKDPGDVFERFDPRDAAGETVRDRGHRLVRDGPDGFHRLAEGLVEMPDNDGAESSRKFSTRQRKKMLDAGEADVLERFDGVRINVESGERKRRNRPAFITGGNGVIRVAAEPRNGTSAHECGGDGGAGVKSTCVKRVDELASQRVLAVKKLRTARDVKQNAVGRIHGYDRRKTLRKTMRKLMQRQKIALRLVRHHLQHRGCGQRVRMTPRHARRNPQPLRMRT